MAGLLLAGAASLGVGGLLKFLSHRSDETAQHLRGVQRLSVAEIADALAHLPSNTRIYAATEGLLVPKTTELVEATDGEGVLYSHTTTKEVTRSWQWTPTGGREGGRDRGGGGSSSSRSSSRRRGRDNRSRETGYWKSIESESPSRETNERCAGIGIFSGDSAAFLDAGVEKTGIGALTEKHREYFIQKTAAGGTTVVVNNNNGGRHSDPERPPPPEVLGYRKVEHVVRADKLAFTVGEFYLATDPRTKHKAVPEPSAMRKLHVGQPITNLGNGETKNTPVFLVGHGTLNQKIATISTTSRNLNTTGNIVLLIGGGLFAGGIIKYAMDRADEK